jgi:hydrogenase maturation protease
MSWISFVKLRVLSGSAGQKKCCEADSTVDGTHSRDKLRTMSHVLIVAYGNPMRCDDGLAWRAATALEGKFFSSQVEIVRSHQLAPELAETVSRCEAVIFVDAAPAGNGLPGEIRCAQVSLPEAPPRFSHQLSPDAVVALARQLFGARPEAFSVTLTGHCFDHGESLSPVVTAALPALVARIEALIQQFLALEAPSGSNKA